MTKKEYEMYHKEVYDKYHSRLFPGDTVIIPNSYLNDCHVGIVKHFASRTVIIDVYDPKWKWYKQQRYPNRIIKVKSEDGTTDFMQNWPKRKPETT